MVGGKLIVGEVELRGLKPGGKAMSRVGEWVLRKNQKNELV